MPILDRVKTRINEKVDDKILTELILTVNDRLCLRLGADGLPSLFESICVDATVKMYRRMYYEGINSEGVEGLSTSFVDDVLFEYQYEINNWKERQSYNSTQRVVNFL